MSNYRHLLTKTVEKLSESNSYQGLFHQYKDGEPLPSGKTLHHIIDLARSILFPGYFGNSTIHSQTIQYHIGVNIEELFALLTEQIQAGLCFGERNIEQKKDSISCKDKAVQLAVQSLLPQKVHPGLFRLADRGEQDLLLRPCHPRAADRPADHRRQDLLL